MLCYNQHSIKLSANKKGGKGFFMLDLQKEFIEFHEKIKLDDENQKLRDKRDILLKKLKNNICEDAASYTTFNQGSYAMGTGIYPEDNDYDIDVGIKFNIDKDEHSDPLEPKEWVKDALDGHTKKVEIRRSCVTVTYQEDGEPAYHVDFAVYAANNSDEKMYIAKGKPYSDEEHRYWEVSDPQGLIKEIKDKYSGDDAAQFRRVIRYMKKWKNHNFSSSGDSAPTGIAITILAYDGGFDIKKTYDWATGKNAYDDFSALYYFVNHIRNRFTYGWSNNAQQMCHKITLNLPVEPYNNLFDKMTDKQMEEFYQKIDKMLGKLNEVKSKVKRSEACTILAELFGEDFPITVDKSMVGTSESA